MRGQAIQLPSRFPVGTRYVIEGRGGRIRLRYLEFPDGRKVDLPADLAGRTKARNSARKLRNGRNGPRKKI
ncbi:MAG TPA: hypothetical protein VIY51_18560 [Xanthobacteraceae bacterium]